MCIYANQVKTNAEWRPYSITSFAEQKFDEDRVVIGVRNAVRPVRLSPKLVRLASGWPMMVLPLLAGLAGRGTRPVTLYTPNGPQSRTLSMPRVVDVRRPSPVEAGDRHGHGPLAAGCEGHSQ